MTMSEYKWGKKKSDAESGKNEAESGKSEAERQELALL